MKNKKMISLLIVAMMVFTLTLPVFADNFLDFENMTIVNFKPEEPEESTPVRPEPVVPDEPVVEIPDEPTPEIPEEPEVPQTPIIPGPTVSVDGNMVNFSDQEPVISENGDTLIPIRAVLEAMGAYVEWRDKDRAVYVKAKDNIIRLLLTIDKPTMTKYTLKTLTSFDKEEITLSTPTRIMNGRTMIPLRAACEGMGAEVQWNPETRHISITSPVPNVMSSYKDK